MEETPPMHILKLLKIVKLSRLKNTAIVGELDVCSQFNLSTLLLSSKELWEVMMEKKNSGTENRLLSGNSCKTRLSTSFSLWNLFVKKNRKILEPLIKRQSFPARKLAEKFRVVLAVI